MIIKCEEENQCLALKAVSYTHLDVYKRQVLSIEALNADEHSQTTDTKIQYCHILVMSLIHI